jgi:hypothetical protein
MGMGGFVLENDDCEVFPVVLGAFLWNHPRKLGKHEQMKPAHFEFKTVYKREQINLGQKLCKNQTITGDVHPFN